MMWCNAPGASVLDFIGMLDQYHIDGFRQTGKLKDVPYISAADSKPNWEMAPHSTNGFVSLCCLFGLR